MGSVRHSLFLLNRGQFDLPSTLIGQARPYVGDRSESEGKTSAPGSYKDEKKHGREKKASAGAEGGASFHLLPREPQALALSHPERDRESFLAGPELGGRRA